MQKPISLKPGDYAYTMQCGFGATRYTKVIVKKVTATQIVIENGNRYRISDGGMVGYSGSYSYTLVEPTEEVIKAVEDYNIRDEVRIKFDRIRNITASPMHMDIEKVKRLGNAIDEMMNALGGMP